MSDTHTKPEPTGTVPEPTEPDTTSEPTDTTSEPAETTPESADTAPGDKAAREAAKYRRRLREVEAERDRLAEQVQALQQAEIERLSYDKYYVKGAAIWAGGYTVSDLIGEDGRPDETKVAAAAADVAERFGIRRLTGAYVPSEGKTPPDPLRGSVTWDKLLHPNRS